MIEKRNKLIDALNKGIQDGSSDVYRKAYDSHCKYRYTDQELLEKRGRIDAVLNSVRSKNAISPINFF